MKREEGGSHGLVQTLPPPPPSAVLLGSPPATTGMFNKVSRKSRRQRCNCCHDNPVCGKSKDKVRGTHHKMKKGSGGVGSDLRLVSKRVVDSRTGLHYSGFSDDVGNKKEEDEEGVADENGLMDDPVDTNGLIGDPDIGSGDVKDDDDKISFYDVGFVWEEVDDEDEDEGWCLVG